jgi:hypothetical protein
MNDYDVTLRLDLEPGGEPMEALALRVLDAVERHASELALGPVVSGTTDPPSIELDFDVVAASSAEAHEHIARVIGAIERHAGVHGIRSAFVVEREPVGS